MKSTWLFCISASNAMRKGAAIKITDRLRKEGRRKHMFTVV
jgi:hypothetical protein